MHPVAYQLRRGVFGSERRDCRAGLAVIYRIHAVQEMRRVGYSVFVAELRLLKCRGGVRGGHRAYLRRLVRKFYSSRKLGRQRHKSYFADFIELFELVYVRLMQIFRILRAALCI